MNARPAKQPPEAVNDRLLALAVEAVRRVGWPTATVEACEFSDAEATYRVGSDVQLCFFSPRLAFQLPDDLIVEDTVRALRHEGEVAIVFLGSLLEELRMKEQGLDT